MPRFSDVSWLAPEWIVLLALLPAAWWIRSRRGEPAVLFAPAPVVVDHGPHRVRTTWRENLRGLPWLVRAAAWTCCVAALMQPVTRVALPRTTVGIDLLLCIDVSSSMAARDMRRADDESAQATSRLEIAKDAATRFIATRPEDRIGLLKFAAYADLVCPLTLDHRAVDRLLHDVDLVDRDGPEDLTGIGNAVARAASILQGSEAASKVVVLLSDGEENVAHPDAPTEIGPAQAAGMAREFGVRVYTIAAGRGNPGPRGEFTPLDTRAIEQLATVTGGAFFSAEDEQGAREVFRAVDELEKSPLDDPRFRTESLHPWLVWPAIALLLAAILIERSVARVRP